jgi:glycosyltransferase involved in cell wall biosynthesis
MISQLFPLSHYTIFLGKGLDSLENAIEMFYYRSKSENKDVPLKRVKSTWSKSIKYPFEVFRQCVKDKPDVAHIQHEFNMFGDKMTALVFPLLLFFLKLGRFKTVVTVHAVVPSSTVDSFFAKTFAFPKNLSILLRIFLIITYRSILIWATAIVVHANYSRSIMLGDYKAKSGKVFVVPIGVSPCRSEETERGKWSRQLKGKRAILFFGYLVERKGVEYLIEAFARVSKSYENLILVIAGGVLSYSSPYIEMLVALISKLNLSNRVVFLTTTPFPIDELHELYELSEFVVLPYTYSFSSSLALSFAMQHSKPVIATNVGVFKEEIEDNLEGLLCSPNSSDSLEYAMNKLIKSKHLNDVFSFNMRVKADRKDWSLIAQKNLQVYVDILG